MGIGSFVATSSLLSSTESDKVRPTTHDLPDSCIRAICNGQMPHHCLSLYKHLPSSLQLQLSFRTLFAAMIVRSHRSAPSSTTASLSRPRLHYNACSNAVGTPDRSHLPLSTWREVFHNNSMRPRFSTSRPQFYLTSSLYETCSTSSRAYRTRSTILTTCALCPSTVLHTTPILWYFIIPT